jgi:hypothetical protein
MKLSLPPKLVAVRRKERQHETQFTTKIGGAQEKGKTT